jgi:VanZ family protein
MKHHPRRVWAGVFLATAITLYFMAAPSDSLGVADLSRMFGGTEITDAIGHVVLFSALTFAWYFALRYRWNEPTAFVVAVVAVGLLGTVAELSQHFVPHRGMALLDLLANWTGVLLFVLMCKTVNNRLRLDA